MNEPRMRFTAKESAEVADKLHALRAERDLLVKALEDIKQATVEGRVCNDVAWFSQIETLHDFCDRILALVGGAQGD